MRGHTCASVRNPHFVFSTSLFSVRTWFHARTLLVWNCNPWLILSVWPLAGEAGDTLWPDGWTAVTKDGKRSAQFEHTLIVTDDGCEIFTARAGASRNSMAWDEAASTRPLGAPSAEAKSVA